MIRGKGSLARHWPGRQWLSDDRFWGLAETPYFIKTRFIPIRPASKTKRAQIHRIDRCRPCRMLTMAPAFQTAGRRLHSDWIERRSPRAGESGFSHQLIGAHTACKRT